MTDTELKAWFTMQVLPLEPQLLAFLRHNSQRREELHDILHDIYERALIGAARALPQNTRGYVFVIARNLLITRAKRAKIVSFDLYADIEAALGDVSHWADELTPERHSSARQELQRAMDGLAGLPPRCREVVRLRKIEGLSTKEAASRLGVSVAAVEQQLTLGMRALTDFMLGGTGRIERRHSPLALIRGRGHD